jgi:diaminopimelate epimerase
VPSHQAARNHGRFIARRIDNTQLIIPNQGADDSGDKEGLKLVKFTKMHGLGNDFVVFDFVTQHASLSHEKIRAIANRHFGIGCDQVLVVEPPSQPDMDFRYRIYNADGNEVEQCGNGARCFAKFVHDKKLISKKTILVETLGGPLKLQLEKNNLVSVNMGLPEFEPEKIPFQAEMAAGSYTILANGQEHEIGAVALGNPHAVLLVEDVERAPVNSLGPAIESHTRFPSRVNVGFMQVMSPGEIKLRVYERGVGETLACGSGACAAVVVGIARGILENEVDVHLRGGKVKIKWQGQGSPVEMTGPAATVFEGQIVL